MRICPQCNRSYPDDINFCLDDGTTLVAESQIVTAPMIEVRTVVRNGPLPIVPAIQTTREMRTGSGDPPRRRSGLLFASVGIVVCLVIGAGGGVTFYWLQSSSSKTSEILPADSNAGVAEKPAPGNGASEPKAEKVDQTNADGQRKPFGNGEQAVNLAESEPDNYEAQMDAARFLYGAERYDEAIRKLNRAHEIDPDKLDPMINLGNCYFDSKRYKEARNWYQKVIDKTPENVAVRTDMGLTYVLDKKPDYESAIREFERSLETDPDHPQTLQNLTVAYIAKKDAVNARLTLKKLEEADPANKDLDTLRERVNELKR